MLNFFYVIVTNRSYQYNNGVILNTASLSLRLKIMILLIFKDECDKRRNARSP